MVEEEEEEEEKEERSVLPSGRSVCKREEETAVEGRNQEGGWVRERSCRGRGAGYEAGRHRTPPLHHKRMSQKEKNSKQRPGEGRGRKQLLPPVLPRRSVLSTIS